MTTKHEWKLCYVEGNFAYFTSIPLENQWGDDWDDAPYEHNAGEPYEEHGPILKVAFGLRHLERPCDTGRCLSVETINKGKIPWLAGARAIYAGATLATFMEFMDVECMGEYYFRPADMHVLEDKP